MEYKYKNFKNKMRKDYYRLKKAISFFKEINNGI